MTHAIDMAWRDFEVSDPPTEGLLETIHAAMVRRIMLAVRNGERDPAKLRLAALRAIRWT